MATLDINIDASRLRWAVERAGLTVNDYVCSHPSVAFHEWVSGNKKPTFKQLETFAKSVNVPFGYLFLDKTPEESVPFPVFRGEAGRRDHFDLNVYDTANCILKRQEWLEDYLEDNGIETCGFVNSANLRTPVMEATSKLRNALGLDSRWAFALANPNVAVNMLTERMELAGVFVTFSGIVGNNTRRTIDVRECRGFALVSKTAPCVFVNSGDSPSAQLFTLIHETAHILIGRSAGHIATDTLCDDAEERWCDSVAAEFLVPTAELRDAWNGDLKNISKKFKTSELVIARKAHDLGLLSDDGYRKFWMSYNKRDVARKKSSGGGNFYKTSVKRVGKLFAIHVRSAVRDRQLSYTEAYRLTNLYGRTYDKFMTDSI